MPGFPVFHLRYTSAPLPAFVDNQVRSLITILPLIISVSKIGILFVFMFTNRKIFPPSVLYPLPRSRPAIVEATSYCLR